MPRSPYFRASFVALVLTLPGPLRVQPETKPEKAVSAHS